MWPNPTLKTELRPRQMSWRRWWLLLALMLLLATALAATQIGREFSAQRDLTAARVRATAELRVSQLESLRARQLGSAAYLADSSYFADLFSRWQIQGDAVAGAQVLERAVAFSRANGGSQALLLGAGGRVLASSEARADPPSPALLAAVPQAELSQAPVLSAIYRRDDASMPLLLDVVVPLLHTPGAARGLLVLRLDARRTVFPLLAGWPEPSASGESVLFRRDGARLVMVSDGRAAVDAAERLSQPLADSGLVLARHLRGELPAGAVALALDYRGVQVLATPQPVAGSDWWLVAKIDRDEAELPAWHAAGWITAVTLLALLAIGLLARLWLLHLDQAAAAHAAAEHGGRLRTLALLEAITESAADAIFAKDLDGRYVFYNQAAAAEAGRAREQVLGRQDSEIFTAVVAAAFVANDRQVMASGQTLRFEEQIPRGDHVQINLCVKGPLRDGQGRVIGTFGMGHNVTAIRRTELALRDSGAHYRSVVSALSEGVLVCDPQGRVLSCNPAAERILGLRQADWLGQPFVPTGWTPLHADGRTMALAEIPTSVVLAGGPPQHGVVLAARRPDDSIAWFELGAVPVRSPDDDRLLAVVTSFVDVTDRHRLDAELARHRDRLEHSVAERTAELASANARLEQALRFNTTVTDALPARVSYWDTGGICRFANRGYCESVGLPLAQVLGKRPREIHGAADLSAVRLAAAGAMTGKAQSFEWRVQALDGTPKVYLTHYIPDLNAEAAVVGMYAIAFDITAIKQAQTDLHHANFELAISRDAAQAATRAKSAFLANMSHEIRTPMNAIIGLTQLLARDANDPVASQRLGHVGDAARHLMMVINDVLDLSKIEAGRMALETTAFELAPLLARSLEMVRAKAEEKGLALALTLGPLPQRLGGDPTRLSQVLINLLGNAVKFTAWGQVRLSGRILEAPDSGAVDRGQRSVLLHFEVEDTGEGIAAQHQAALFNAFEQADNSITRRHGGTGLGLALTRHLVTLMGGEIGLSSVLGQGSRFWFSARFELDESTSANNAANDPAAQPAFGPGRADGGADMDRLRQRCVGRRVLVVEDNLINQEIAGELLRELGLQVALVEDGVAAIDRVLAGGIDLVLMDMQMPVMDGLEATRRLRQTHAVELPIIAMTANVFADDRQACERAGMNDHIGKPIELARLYAALARWLPTAMVADGVAAPVNPAPKPAAATAGPPPRREPLGHDDLATPLRQRLAGVDGLVVAQALAHCGGKPAILEMVLRSFAKTYRCGDAALQPADPPGDERRLWGRACHTLRGVCSAIAADRLLWQIDVIERHLADPQLPLAAVPLLLQVLDADLIALAGQLSAALGTAADRVMA